MSSADLEICATLRDNVHNLNLDDPKDKNLYHAYRATFIILLEGARLKVISLAATGHKIITSLSF